MAFDAGMVAASAAELRNRLIGGRIDKISQPEKDELTVSVRTADGTYARLCISASNNNPRSHITARQKENPMSAPMFCMLLRKHLSGGRVLSVEQRGFERVIDICAECRDEMGFLSQRHVIAEIMGKYSNIIFCDGDYRILGAVKPVDFSTSQKRQVLPGMRYELPPAQDKQDPTSVTEEAFLAAAARANPDCAADRFLVNNYFGIAPVTAREIVFSVAGRVGVTMAAMPSTLLWEAFSAFMARIREERFVPVLLLDPEEKPVEYTFFPTAQYGSEIRAEEMPSFGALIDRYFSERDHVDRVKQRAQDIFKLLANAEARLNKKILQQERELLDCAEGDTFRKCGDLITANIWQLQRGMTEAALVDYESENLDTVKVVLDHRLSPSQNAQKYYKRYNKTKHAEVALTEQIALAREELSYIDTVLDALTHAETESDLDEIRDELYNAGYASRMKAYAQRKNKPVKPLEFRTTNGYRVLVGKNNHQNEYITHKLASKNDMWFHIKNEPGSHAVMFCGEDWESVPEQDYTDAAMIAAVYSKAGEAKHAEVDYTHVRNLKKPPSAKPGMVIYHKNWSAYVTPDAKAVDAMRITEKKAGI
ncbi:MAG: NFACT family protein [Clostridia bacterium]|nr:NFACT family protein [Clostridia bacterium]